MLLRIVVAAGLLLAASSPARAEWRQAESENFTVIGDMPEARLREWSELLEQYHGMLAFLLDAKRTSPVTVYVVSGMSDVQKAMGGGGSARGVAGFYNASAQGAIAVVPERLNFSVEDFNPRIILLHEYAHHMLLTGVNLFMPGWAQEGLAEMFATAKFEKDGSVVIGDKNDSRADAMLGMSRWSVERMLDSDFNPPRNRDANIEKYSRGWALVHYLWISGERPGQYGEFIAELNRTVDPVASGEKVFGDLGRLDRELDRYIRAHRYNLKRFTPDMIGTPGEVSVRPLTAGEVAMIDYRLVSTLGVTEEEARRLVGGARPIAARYPDDARVQAWLAEMGTTPRSTTPRWRRPSAPWRRIRKACSAWSTRAARSCGRRSRRRMRRWRGRRAAGSCGPIASIPSMHCLSSSIMTASP